MKSKYKLTSSRHIDGEGKLSEYCAAVFIGVVRESMLVTTGTLGAGAVLCELKELSLVHWIPRSEQ